MDGIEMKCICVIYSIKLFSIILKCFKLFSIILKCFSNFAIVIVILGHQYQAETGSC